MLDKYDITHRKYDLNHTNCIAYYFPLVVITWKSTKYFLSAIIRLHTDITTPAYINGLSQKIRDLSEE